MLGTIASVARRQPGAVASEARARDAERVAREIGRARDAVARIDAANAARPSLVVPQDPATAPPPPPPPGGTQTTELPGGGQIQTGPEGTTITGPDGRQTVIGNGAGGGVRIVTPEGKVLSIGPNGIVRGEQGDVFAGSRRASQNDIPPEVVPMVGTIFGLTALTIIGFPIARAFARRMDRKTVAAPAAAPEITGRLERIEQAIEAIAVEIERVSEGQRYSARLLTDRLPQTDVLRDAAAERVR
jgi:hypothetical protein